MSETIIRVRCGINGFKYSACDKDGNFIGNFEKLSDVRKHWIKEVRCGQVVLVRELDKMPDMTKIDSTIKILDWILKEYGRRKESPRKASVLQKLDQNKVIRQRADTEKSSQRERGEETRKTR